MNVLRVLVFTSSPLSSTNGIGNTFSNLLSGISDFDFYSLCFKPGSSDFNRLSKAYQITEKEIVLSRIFNSNPGHYIKTLAQEDAQIGYYTSSSIFKVLRNQRWIIYFWIRELIWILFDKKNKEYNNFLKDVNPDVIFASIYDPIYLNRILLDLNRKLEVPLIGYIADDFYTLKQFSWSPFYWIYRLMKRRYVKKSAMACDLLYVISEVQKIDYDIAFNKNCKVLRKGADFSIDMPNYSRSSETVRFLYTGNIGDNRYRTLGMLGKALERLKDKNFLGELHIYTATPISNKIKRVLNQKSIILHTAVTFDSVKKLQRDFDVLVHVEAFSFKDRLAVRHSFSTKIIDYFAAGKAIMAIGPKEVASINYLIKEDAALIANSQSEINDLLLSVADDTELLGRYAVKGWECGQRNHQISQVQRGILDDFKSVIKSSEA